MVVSKIRYITGKPYYQSSVHKSIGLALKKAEKLREARYSSGRKMFKNVIVKEELYNHKWGVYYRV